jgi:hypothetical protein
MEGIMIMTSDMISVSRDFGLGDLPTFTLVDMRALRMIDVPLSFIAYVRFNVGKYMTANFTVRPTEQEINGVLDFCRDYIIKFPETEVMVVNIKHPDYIYYKLYHNSDKMAYYEITPAVEHWKYIDEMATIVRKNLDPVIVLNAGRLYNLNYGYRALASVWSIISDDVAYRPAKSSVETNFTAEGIAFLDGYFCGKGGNPTLSAFNVWAYNNMLPFLGVCSSLFSVGSTQVNTTALEKLIKKESTIFTDAVVEGSTTQLLLPESCDLTSSSSKTGIKITELFDEGDRKNPIDIMVSDLRLLQLRANTLYQIVDCKNFKGQNQDDLGINLCYIYNNKAFIDCPLYEILYDGDGEDDISGMTTDEQVDYLKKCLLDYYDLELAEFLNVGG